MALPEKKQDLLTAKLAPLAMPEGPSWLKEARDAALSRLTQSGLPGPHDEYWRYTNPESINAPEPIEAAIFNASEKMIFSHLERLDIVFVDGVFDEEASDPLEEEGLEIIRLAEAPDLHWAREAYGKLEARAQQDVPRPFAALNTAFAKDGVMIRAKGEVKRPVSLIYRHKKTTSDAILHHVIRVDSGASLTVLENGPAAARFNKTMEVELETGAKFNHIRAQGRDHERRAITHTFADIAEGASYKSFTLTMNGILTRNEHILTLSGDNASAHVAGAALGHGNFHHDDTVFITHDAQNCESRQVFKKVLTDGAIGVFQGKILVKPDAQKTDGYQISQSLLLDETSQFLAKPELEIYADDVACSHGSTSGAIDPTSLFYLRSRGIPEAEARDLLVMSFLAEAIEEIEEDALKQAISQRLEAWLERRRG